MNVSAHELALEAIDAVAVDTVCLFVAEDERPLTGLAGYVDWRMCGALSRLLMGTFFAGAAGDTVLMPSSERLPAVRIFLVGMGKQAEVTLETLQATFKVAAEMLNKAKVAGVALEPPFAPSLVEEARVNALKTAFLPAFSGERVAVFGEKNLTRLLAG